MSKKFNIHEWQAKRRQLSEQPAMMDLGDLQRRGYYDEKPDKEENPVAAKGDGLEITQDEMDKLHKDGRVKLKNGSVLVYMKEETINEISQEVVDGVNGFIDTMARKYDIPKQSAVYNIIRVIKSQNYDGLEEHHAGDYKPGFLKQSVNTFLDKLKKKTKEGKDYKTVEKIMEKYFSAKKKNEASTTGTGASFTAGTGAAYATPKAFGDDKRKKKKGYMGYKEI
jgi:hypothetical protein